MAEPNLETHIWEGLKEYKISSSDELILFMEEGTEGQAEILRKLRPNEYLVVRTIPAESKDVKKFNDYIKQLRRRGLDIGKGNAEYGFKMPLPQKKDKDSYRKLIVFRRR